MQTFLPLPNLTLSAKVLDRQRLGKQRSETKIIFNILTGQHKGTGWANHPAVRMWKGHESVLACYGYEICREWVARGYLDSLLPFFDELRKNVPPEVKWPYWFGWEKFHASHRAALLAKNPTYYQRFGWKEKPGIHYFWPTPREIAQ